MSKFLLSAALVATVVLAITSDASARCRRYRWRAPAYQFQYSAPVAPAAVGTPVPPPPAVAARPAAGSTYRSFSYDPQEAPVYPAPPLAGRRLYPSEPPFFRADHKMLGTSYTN